MTNETTSDFDEPMELVDSSRLRYLEGLERARQAGMLVVCADVKPATIRTGDTVLHRPSGETWLVACVRGDYIAWCGWPEGEAKLTDCDLISSATDAEHWEWVERIAKSAGGFRARYCQTLIDALQQPLAAICPQCGRSLKGHGGTYARDGRDTLIRLLDEWIIEDILAMSDEEILADARAKGIDPEEHAREMRALFERAKAQVDGLPPPSGWRDSVLPSGWRDKPGML